MGRALKEHCEGLRSNTCVLGNALFPMCRKRGLPCEYAVIVINFTITYYFFPENLFSPQSDIVTLTSSYSETSVPRAGQRVIRASFRGAIQNLLLNTYPFVISSVGLIHVTFEFLTDERKLFFATAL